MSSEEDIQFINHILRNKEVYNYVIHLKKLDIKDNDEEANKLMNTLELFAFGDYLHFLSYQNYYIVLDSVLLIKLIRLTILSAAMQEGLSIKIDKLLTEYKLGPAIEHYIEIAGEKVSKDLIFEKICIDMVDDSIIEIKFNDVENTVVIGKTNVIRDSFDNNTTALRILKEKDIAGKNLANALINLQEWFEKSLDPTKTDIDAQIDNTNKTKDINLRKRKPSDNCSL